MHWSAGFHAVETALAAGPAGVRRVLIDRRRRDARMQRLIERAERAGIRLERVDTATLDACVPGVRHQGVCAELDGPGILDERGLRELLEGIDRPLVLALDRVQDPHNLGACMRSAEAAGAHAVVIPRDRAARVTPAVARSSAGAVHRLPLAAVTNLVRSLEGLKEAGCWVVGAAGEASTDLFAAELDAGLALVLGAEDQGLRRRTRTACDQLVAIPLAGEVASLNVSVAAGVCLFEAVRQRRAHAGAA